MSKKTEKPKVRLRSKSPGGDRQMATRGLVIVNTGDGKGKTTAALGIALRAVGHGKKVLILQFMKGSLMSGELKSAKLLSPLFAIRTLGSTFIDFRRGPTEKHKKEAARALQTAQEEISCGKYDLVVLDEINNAVDYGLIQVKDILNIIRTKPAALHLIFTGRSAHKKIIAVADTVTEMREIKHPFQKGIKARKGIEY
jgi:cob(I)alamin adenosyltransferase